MTQTDITTLVTLLSDHFAIPAPRVTLTSARRSYCRFRDVQDKSRSAITIGLGRSARMLSLEDVTLHEFTHALVWARQGRHTHTRVFFDALTEVIAVWKPVRDYTWDREYKSLWKTAQAEGLTDTTTWAFAKVKATPAPAAIALTKGRQVTWNSPRSGYQTGVVLSARAGCRAKVKTVAGALYYVPQSWLQAVA